MNKYVFKNLGGAIKKFNFSITKEKVRFSLIKDFFYLLLIYVETRY